ncbi:MAG: alpha/beta hydrolase [Lachnospiraceae bacterium]|nr:alpha/beta hydrolase [Lachnospiraceae bacterium]MBR6349606.1 alpha/beta hydrolase [Lachnospiraceae bacterium]
MAEFLFDNKKVYYEVHGDSGELLILTNGIMMSTASWIPFIKPLSRGRRLVLVDFFDQGQSERLAPGYDHDIQIELLEALARELEEKYGEKTFNLAGISYGAEVNVQYVLRYPHRVKRLILSNGAARTSSWLRNIGDGWNAVAESGNGRSYYLTAIPVIYSTRFFEEHAEWMDKREQLLIDYFSNKEVLERMIRLTDSSRDFDVVDRLHEIKCPTLIISASEDGLVPATEQLILHAGIKGSSHITINGSGHGSMYEDPDAFATLVGGFADLPAEPITV